MKRESEDRSWAPLAVALDAAATAVDDVAGLPAADTAWRTSDRDVVDAVGRLARIRAALDSIHLSLVREVDSRGVATSSTVATTPEGLLRSACLLTAGEARRDVAATRATSPRAPLARFGAELAAGRVSRRHVDVATRCLERLPEALLDRPGAAQAVSGYLLDAAADATPADLERAARHLLATLAPDPEDRRDEQAHRRRLLDLATDATGMTVGRFQLDPVTGALLRTALERWAAPGGPGAEVDPDTATEVVGPDGITCGEGTSRLAAADRREARQRRADGLAHALRLALATPEGRAWRRCEPARVVVHTTPEQPAGAAAIRRALLEDGVGEPDAVRSLPVGLAEAEGGAPLPTWATRALACDATLPRLVAAPEEGPAVPGTERPARLARAAPRPRGP
ncbi:DUF222 domain-containing protein [Aquipuribacter nitratireducens]|uniref:DUF222 domain-containing protein n=1 Tax=Aquipuribacter nitratireducens TaxID=650104 RepID=A0ABW0GLA0_9MICO